MSGARAIKKLMVLLLSFSFVVVVGFTLESLVGANGGEPGLNGVQYSTITMIIVVISAPLYLMQLFETYYYSRKQALGTLSRRLEDGPLSARWHAIHVFSLIAGSRFGKLSWSNKTTNVQCAYWKNWVEKNFDELVWDDRLDRYMTAGDLNFHANVNLGS